MSDKNEKPVVWDKIVPEVINTIRHNSAQYYTVHTLGSKFGLRFADFNINIRTSVSEAKLAVTHNYMPFIQPLVNMPDVVIDVKIGIPKNIREAQSLFKAQHELSDKEIASENLWSVNKLDGKYVVLASNTELTIYPYIAAVFEAGGKQWTLYIDSPTADGLLLPLSYPMGPLLMYYVVAWNKSLMVHAGGVSAQLGGFMFSGFSGVGKTTMSNLWKADGNVIINDDRLLIRKHNGQYYLYNSPMYYSDEPRKAPLRGVFLLKQSPFNYHKQLNGAMAVSRMMAFCIQHDYDELLIDNMLSTLTELVKEVPVFELGFLPNQTAVDYIKQMYLSVV